MSNTFIDTDGKEQLLIDGDTLTNDTGKRFRIDGLDALEVDKVVTENGEPVFKRGDLGGNSHTSAIAELIRQGGFNKVNYSGEEDNSKGERELIGLSNDKGEDMVSTAAAAGLLKVNEYTSERALLAKEEGSLIRALYGDEAVPYSDLAKQHNAVANSQGKLFKTLAINEKYYDPNLHSGVQFRSPDRTMDNQADGILTSVGVSYDLGWEGVKEGLWGFAEGLGQTSGIEMLEFLGDAGVARARERMKDMPEVTLDYREVDSIGKGFQYVLNNTAMMIPQVMTLFGSMALAVPATALGGPAAGAAVALAPISLISAGQVWNEMEGEKGIGQFITASMAGVGVAVLERFGLTKLISPAKVLSPGGAKKVIEAMSQKNNISIPEATLRFNKIAKQEVGKFSKELALRFDSKDFNGFSFKELGKRGAVGFGVEAGTEMAQELLQMGTVAGVSDKEYTGEDVYHRLVNAGLAGGGVGAKLSMAGSLMNSGKNALLGSERENYSADRFNLIENQKIKKLQEIQISNDPMGKISSTKDLIDDINKDTSFDYKKNDGIAKKLSKAYIDTQKGVKNWATKNTDLFNYIGSAMGGAKKLVLAAEKNVVNFAKLVNSKYGLQIFHLAAAETTGRYHDGGNHKERNDLVSGDIASKIDENYIANLFGARRMTNKNIENISSQIRDFGRTDGKYQSKFQMYHTMKLSLAGAFPLAQSYLDPKTSARDRVGIGLALKQIGLRTPKEINEYFYIANKFQGGIVNLNLNDAEAEIQARLYQASLQIKEAYDKSFEYVFATHKKETGKELEYNTDYWWSHQGFDWRKVKKDKKGFMDFLTNSTSLDLDERNALYESITRDGQGNITTQNSLIGGKTWMPYSYSDKMKGMAGKKGFNKYSSDNMFEAVRRDRLEAAKYTSSTEYFGHGGRKLDYLFTKLRAEEANKPDGMTEAEIEQMAYYITSMIDSTHGNFNRIESKAVAAVNSFLTGWSLLAGLPMAMLSSIPETMLIYFNVKNDVEFQAATKQLIAQVGQLYDDTLKKEVAQTEQLLKKVNQSTDTNSVVDRLATGERDVSFMRVHEAFFHGIGLTKITQVQRRMNAGLALDFIRSGFSILNLAPRRMFKTTKRIDYNPGFNPNVKTIKGKVTNADGKRVDGIVGYEITTERDVGLDFDNMQDIEIRTYNQLTDLGFDVEVMMEYLKDMNHATVKDANGNDMLSDSDEMFNYFDKQANESTNPQTYQTPTRRTSLMKNSVKGLMNRGFKQLPSGLPNTLEMRKQGNVSVMNEMSHMQSYIDDKIDLAVYRYVKERVQLPSGANRPLAFQDPHYQLIFQFNGFLSTFTGNLVPKIWNSQLRKGTAKVKYDTFALVITMIALGGVSQYLKDLIKFGGKTPYLDNVGLVQRAVFSSGVLGQYERIVDAIHPLYPERDTGSDFLFNKILGEAGPSARNIQKVAVGTGQILAGQSELGVNKLFSATPGIGPFTGGRRALTDALHGNNPLKQIDLPNKNEILDSLLN